MNKHKGLTLLNLLITTTITALLVTIGVPTLSGLVQKVETTQQARQLLRLINYARLQAVNYRRPVLLCPTKDNQSCNGDWSSDIVIFRDDNSDNEYQEGQDTLLSYDNIASKNLTINWRSFGSKPYISFDAYGTTGYQNGRVYICGRNEKTRVQLIIYRTGRVRYAPESQLNDGCG